MAWQKCPICSGSGQGNGVGYPTAGPCHTCNGVGIIDKSSGLPPKRITITSTNIKIPLGSDE